MLSIQFKLHLHILLCCFSLIACTTSAGEPEVVLSGSVAEGDQIGPLIMIGGGLAVNHDAVFEGLIQAAGGKERSQFVIMPAASVSLQSAELFRTDLMQHGLRADQISIVNILHTNAPESANSQAHVDLIDRSTAVFMTGGDQVRLVRCLTKAEGTDSPVLAAMRRLHRRGGLIAGTSAGASAQSRVMLAVSGLPDRMVDEGLDALDFGLTQDPKARGLLVTQGLGFHSDGTIDQHFLQYRGRLGRLSRVVVESKLPFGVGVDKNSAIEVDRSGQMTVLGGSAVVVIPREAQLQDAPTGCSITNMRIALLSRGDRYDPVQGTFTVASTKHALTEADATFDGNFLIPDIGSGYAITSALIGGLAENTQSRQVGIVQQFHGTTSHGYRYTFEKTSTTRVYHGDGHDGSLYSVFDIQLNVTPIANGIGSSSAQVPTDLQGLARDQSLAIQRLVFRGMMTGSASLAFRPNQPLTRREFAIAAARSVQLNAPPRNMTKPNDLGEEDEDREEILQAIAAGFVSLDNQALLKPDSAISPADCCDGLARLAERAVSKASEKFESKLELLRSEKGLHVSRANFAEALSLLLFNE